MVGLLQAIGTYFDAHCLTAVPGGLTRDRGAELDPTVVTTPVYPFATVDVADGQGKPYFGDVAYSSVAAQFTITGDVSDDVEAAALVVHDTFRRGVFTVTGAQITERYFMHLPKPVPLLPGVGGDGRDLFSWLVTIIYKVRTT